MFKMNKRIRKKHTNGWHDPFMKHEIAKHVVVPVWKLPYTFQDSYNQILTHHIKHELLPKLEVSFHEDKVIYGKNILRAAKYKINYDKKMFHKMLRRNNI